MENLMKSLYIFAFMSMGISLQGMDHVIDDKWEIKYLLFNNRELYKHLAIPEQAKVVQLSKGIQHQISQIQKNNLNIFEKNLKKMGEFFPRPYASFLKPIPASGYRFLCIKSITLSPFGDQAVGIMRTIPHFWQVACQPLADFWDIYKMPCCENKLYISSDTPSVHSLSTLPVVYPPKKGIVDAKFFAKLPTLY